MFSVFFVRIVNMHTNVSFVHRMVNKREWANDNCFGVGYKAAKHSRAALGYDTLWPQYGDRILKFVWDTTYLPTDPNLVPHSYVV